MPTTAAVRKAETARARATEKKDALRDEDEAAPEAGGRGPSCRQVDRQAGRQTGRCADRQTGSVDRQAGRQVDRQAGVQTGRQVGR
jgi:hypothetical protein